MNPKLLKWITYYNASAQAQPNLDGIPGDQQLAVGTFFFKYSQLQLNNETVKATV